jgi:hypothetical protein
VLLCRRHHVLWHQGRVQLRDLHVPWLIGPTGSGADPPDPIAVGRPELARCGDVDGAWPPRRMTRAVEPTEVTVLADMVAVYRLAAYRYVRSTRQGTCPDEGPGGCRAPSADAFGQERSNAPSVMAGPAASAANSANRTMAPPTRAMFFMNCACSVAAD